MAEQTFSPDLNKQAEKYNFLDFKKQNIVDKVSPKIERDMKKVDDREQDLGRRKAFKFGATFEDIASEENRLNHPETEKQKQLREIIERMYEDAELILGSVHKRPSKPDGVTVRFDEDGRLSIDEIIEFKSSENALSHGLEIGQPQKTLRTIGNIVDILNRMVSGETTQNIQPTDRDLPFDQVQERDRKLKEIQTEIQGVINKGESITLSQDLVYRIIVPKGIYVPNFNHEIVSDRNVQIVVTQSSFTAAEIFKISDRLSSITK